MKKILKLLYQLLRKNKWLFEYYVIKLKLRNSKCEKRNIPMGKSLIIVPHADDELLGTFGYICINRYTELYYMGFTGSNLEKHNKEIRDKEFISCAEKLGVNYYFADQKDLLNLLEEKKYSNILLPSLVDWHEEHRMCNKILLNALLRYGYNTPELYWYSISVPMMPHDNRIIHLPLSKKLQKYKYELFKKIYISQGFMPIMRFAMQERINAVGTQYFACETIYGLDYNELKKYVSKVELSNDTKNGIIIDLIRLKENISHLKKIRKLSKEIYMILQK